MNSYRGFGALGTMVFGVAKKKKKTSSKKGAKGQAFDAGGTPAQLWRTDPAKRRVDFSGLLSVEDTLIAIAKGMAPGVLDKMEDRATIKGGVASLKALKVKPWASRSVSKLQTRTVQSEKDDAALVKAAGRGKNLREAAKYIQGQVVKHHLSQAAWGARQGYILGNIKGFQIVHGLTASALNFVPVAGNIASAAAAAHLAISGVVAKDVATMATSNVTKGLAYAKKRAGKKAPASSTAKPRSTASAPAAAPAAARKTVSVSSGKPRTMMAPGSASREVEEAEAESAASETYVAPQYKQGKSFQTKAEREAAAEEEGEAPGASSAPSDPSDSSAEEAAAPNYWLWAGGAVVAALGAWALARSGKGAAPQSRVSARASAPRSASSAAAAGAPRNRISLRRKL